MNQKELCKQYGIGITGGIATGKSSVVQILSSWGYLCIDADQLAREAVRTGSEGLAAVVGHFGHDILLPDGSLNRKKLGLIVFRDSAQRKILEGIVHPEIQKLLGQRLDKEGMFQNPRLWFYEAALLFETGLYRSFLEVWLTTSDSVDQIQRLKKSKGISEAHVREIMSAQMPDEEKIKIASRVIENKKDLAALEVTLQSLLTQQKSHA